MLIKDFFIYKKEGMEDEYKKILRSELHMFKVNGGDKIALNYMMGLLKQSNTELLENIKTKTLELLLRERALGEISEMIGEKYVNR